eukprot:1016411-Karenia_brevis.AAC.1
MPEMKSLRAKCDKSHEHAPWQFDLQTGKFPTAAEAEYLELLSVRLARCARDHLLNRQKQQNVEKKAPH